MTKHSNIFFTHNFHSFSEYLRSAKRWKLDFRKLDKGPFSARLTVLDIETVQVIRTQISGIIDQQGQIQSGYRTFVIPAHSSINSLWMDVKVEKNSLIVFPKAGVFRAVTHGNFDIIAVSIQEDHLQEIAEQCNATNLKSNLSDNGCVYVMDEESYAIGQILLHNAFNQLSVNADILNNPDFVFQLKYKIPYLIAHFLNNPNLTALKPLQRKRDIALNKCVEYIINNISSPIPVGSLSEIANTSERTIEYAFIERYGISPKTYITYTKLNKIKDILSSQNNTQNVSTIAQSFGFNHMGQFSADYKNLFGELPRQTLMNSKAVE